MSLDNIWDEPVVSPLKPVPAGGDPGPQKRNRQSLFLSDSDSDYERPPKRATPAPPTARPDVDALFDGLDKEDDDDLRYKPLAPALDLEKLAKEAETRHARARQAAFSQTLASSSKKDTAGGTGKDSSEKDEGKDKPGDGDKKGRKVLPKLDEERLVGPEGFPLLIKEIKGFKPKGKGHEHADLNRLLQIYQFWAHKMYPKTSFKDTISRVEKLCHTKRMQVRLSVWRDEFKGITNSKKLADDTDDPDVIDLTEPTPVGTEDDGDDKKYENSQLYNDSATSRTPSLPPASSEVDDDDFDIDAVIRAEEERLATLRAATTDSGPLQIDMPYSPTLSENARSRSGPEVNAMDVDEDSLWEAFNDPPTLFDPPRGSPPSLVPADEDEDVWNIIDEMEQETRSRPAKAQIPTSGVNLVPPPDSTNDGNTSRATNDEDWEEMYS